MPPKNSCRVCGCTARRSCILVSRGRISGPRAIKSRIHTTCSWVQADLCSACDGRSLAWLSPAEQLVAFHVEGTRRGFVPLSRRRRLKPNGGGG